MRKIWIIAVSSFIALASFSSCGNKQDETDLFGDSEKFKNLAEATLTVCVPGFYGGEESESTRLVLDEIERRTRDTLKVKLEVVTLPWLQYEDELKRTINSGEPCDAYLTFFDESRNVLKTMYDAGLALDVTSLFPEYAPRYYRTLKPEDLAPLTIDGKLLAVRNNYPAVDRVCVVVRDELLQKYNVSSIKGLDDLEAFMAVLKQNEEDMTVLTVTRPLISIFAASFGYAVLNYDLGLVYKWNDPAMKIVAWEQTPEYAKALERAFDWYKKGYVNKIVNQIAIVTPDPVLVRSKKWGIWLMNAGASAYFNEVLASSGERGRFVEFPLFPEAVCQRVSYPPLGLVLSPRSKNPERALMLVEWAHANQENYDLVRYGIQGKHWVLRGDQYAFPEGTARNESYMNRSGFGGLFSDVNFERTHVSSPQAFRDYLRRTLVEEAKYPPHGAAVFDFQGIDTVLRRRTAYDMEWTLLTGGYDADSLRNYIRQEKELGIDKLVLHVQAQLDALRKKNDASR
jgi:putative aldouronate transport system substrate-binding protein